MGLFDVGKIGADAWKGGETQKRTNSWDAGDASHTRGKNDFGSDYSRARARDQGHIPEDDYGCEP